MADQPKKPRRERRLLVRYPVKASTTLVRESDMMRIGMDAVLKDVSIAGIGIVVREPLEVGEMVKIELVNQIQRLEKETRGIVRHVTPRDDGTYHVGVELLLRLTPLEVSLLRMGLQREEEPEGPRWI
ncbi:MAG: PilZ domain-containing protein [Planctomycetes bacterium]|nr:PilZ domain-containing protein [Planctomycetota bacterium]